MTKVKRKNHEDTARLKKAKGKAEMSGRAAERADVVAWLRESALTRTGSGAGLFLANCIERGEHEGTAR